MHKLYLLLRSNKQSGPHSLEELVQLNLKPTDLVWVEGKSSVWSYPTEIEILKPYVSEGKEFFSIKPESTASPSSTHDAYMPPGAKDAAGPKAGPSGKVYVSLPPQMAPKPAPEEKPSTYDLEQKADELRARIQAAAAQNRQVRDNIEQADAAQRRPVGDNIEHVPPAQHSPVREKILRDNAPKNDVKDVPIQVKASRSLNEVEEEYTSWVYKKNAKKREIPAKLVARGVAVALILVGSYLMARYFINTENEPAVQLTDVPAQTSNEAAQPMLTQTETPPEEIGAEDFNAVKEDAPDNNNAQAEPPVQNTSVAKLPSPSNNTGTTNNAGTATRKQVKKMEVPAKSNEGSDDVKTAEPVTPPVRNSEASTKKEEPVVTATPQKKKKFSEKIDDFFNKLKRKKGEEQAETGTLPTEEPETRPSTGGMPERKAKRRGEEAPPVSKIENIEEYIDITSSEPSEKWMLGIQGLKVTLHNRSNEIVKTATVEVRYYNEQNDLLETKMVTFNKIAPKRSMTLGAPDHRLANHTDYRLVSASN